MDDILEELGLTALEIKIYKMLLHDGPNLAGIISRNTGIHRRSVYDAIERLIQKGLVSYIKENNHRIYIAADPEVVLNRLKAKQKEWEDMMPALKKQISMWNEKKETVFFRGPNGIKNAFMDQINVGEEVLVSATSEYVTHTIKHFFPKYQLLRKENNIPTRMIFDSKLSESKRTKFLDNMPLCKYKLIEKFNSSSMSQYVYGNNVSLVVWGDNPFVILIREKEIANAFREKFELFWNLTK